jgi:glycosyltransferase involved in cell wall biosynthesis
LTLSPHPSQQGLAGVRVALVVGNFSPEIGYQEVDLAAAFSRLGADVLVVTSTRPSRNARAIVKRGYPEGPTHGPGYRVLRLRPKVVVGTNVLGCKVLPVVQDFAPDHVVLVGPGKLFGLDLFASPSAPWRRIALIQDNRDDGRSSGPLPKRALRAVVQRAVKQPAYRCVVRNADRIVLSVPETREIVSGSLGAAERDRLAETAVELHLGFDPERFYFDAEARRRWRANHEVGDDEIVLVTCTRATRSKRLELLVDTTSRLRMKGLPVRYVLAGLLDDVYGRELRERVARLDDASGVLLLPVLRQEEMRALFSACDLGFWPRAAISIQQAMGTGLPVVLPRKPNVSHLLLGGRNGWYVEAEQSLDVVIGDAIGELRAGKIAARPETRDATARFNRDYLSYDRIAVEIVSRGE